MTDDFYQLRIGLTQSSGSALLILAGEVDVASASVLGERLEQCISEGCMEITIDMREVTFMDSSGITVLLQALDHLTGRNGRLMLANPTQPVRRVLEISGLSSVFAIAGGEQSGSLT